MKRLRSRLRKQGDNVELLAYYALRSSTDDVSAAIRYGQYAEAVIRWMQTGDASAEWGPAPKRILTFTEWSEQVDAKAAA